MSFDAYLDAHLDAKMNGCGSFLYVGVVFHTDDDYSGFEFWISIIQNRVRSKNVLGISCSP